MKLDAAQQKRLLRLYRHGEPVSELISMFGISRSTFFRTLKLLKLQGSLPKGWSATHDDRDLGYTDICAGLSARFGTRFGLDAIGECTTMVAKCEGGLEVMITDCG